MALLDEFQKVVSDPDNLDQLSVENKVKLAKGIAHLIKVGVEDSNSGIGGQDLVKMARTAFSGLLPISDVPTIDISHGNIKEELAKSVMSTFLVDKELAFGMANEMVSAGLGNSLRNNASFVFVNYDINKGVNLIKDMLLGKVHVSGLPKLAQINNKIKNKIFSAINEAITIDAWDVYHHIVPNFLQELADFADSDSEKVKETLQLIRKKNFQYDPYYIDAKWNTNSKGLRIVADHPDIALDIFDNAMKYFNVFWDQYGSGVYYASFHVAALGLSDAPNAKERVFAAVSNFDFSSAGKQIKSCYILGLAEVDPDRLVELAREGGFLNWDDFENIVEDLVHGCDNESNNKEVIVNLVEAMDRDFDTMKKNVTEQRLLAQQNKEQYNDDVAKVLEQLGL